MNVSAPTTPTTLEAVRAEIPPECYKRSTARGLFAVARSVALYLLVLWGLWSTDNVLLLIPLWVAAALSVVSMFILAHDAAHGALFDAKWLNGLVGRLLMLPSVHVYESWVLGHNRVHHGHTARQGMDFVWHPVTPAEYAAMSRFGRLRHRFEWSRFGAGAYYLRGVWWSKMIRFRPPTRFARRIWRDWWFVVVSTVVVFVAVGGLGWLTSDAALSGAWIAVKLLVIPTLGFMQIIGWAVYVHHIGPDLRWWPRREWNKYRGQMEATTILGAPRWLNVLYLHNIFVHVPHHVDMRIPYYHLPRAGRAITAAFEGVAHRKMRLADYLRTTRRCKLYDFDAGRWFTYQEARLDAAG